VLKEMFGLRVTRQEGSGEIYVMKCLIICTAHENFSGDQMEKIVVGGAYSTYGEV
jgi:hypothetical protein